jgi:serine phosphatase RsbU (regulator of sigma subunit)
MTGSVIIENEEMKIIERDKPIKNHSSRFGEIFFLRNPITYSDRDSDYKRHLGHLTLYSNTGVVLQRVQVAFFILIFNAILKSAALWIIFLWFGRKILGLPLSRLTKEVTQVQLENLEVIKITPPSKRPDELGQLADSFNTMIENLLRARRSLRQYSYELEMKNAELIATHLELRTLNNSLEEKVFERTSVLNKSLTQIKKELFFAREVQNSLLSLDVSEIGGLKISSHYIPASEVSGDFFDIAELSNGNIRIFIADATGHGMRAALITMLLKSEYETVKGVMSSPGQLLRVLNNIFVEKYASLNSFFTCYIMDVDTQNGQITYTSGSHPNQILIKSEKVVPLKITGKLFGYIPNVVYEESTATFEKGDKLVIFTDGIYEEFNKQREQFGEERLYDCIHRERRENVQNLGTKILEHLNVFLEGAEKQDDITLLVIENCREP